MIQLEKYVSGKNEKDPTGYSYFMPSLINQQEQGKYLGGYKEKYLKYKQKYLQLKNNIK